tara:strand:+ start:150 stop:683 length:534 start_codon:yes stop_codon:yes gene_type:complete
MADMSGEIVIDTPKKLQVFKELKARGLPYAAIAGIMGNIDVETGGSFDYKQKQIKGPGYGLFQFEGGHKKAYQNYLNKNERQDSEGSQIDYVLDNITKGEGYDIGAGNRKVLLKTFKSNSPDNIALTFSKLFERPNPKKAHNDRRIKSAVGIYDNLMQRKHGGMVMRNYYDYEPRSI